MLGRRYDSLQSLGGGAWVTVGTRDYTIMLKSNSYCRIDYDIKDDEMQPNPRSSHYLKHIGHWGLLS